MAKQELLATIRDRYRASSKREKSRILDEFIAVTGHHRKHGIRLLGQSSDDGEQQPAVPRQLYLPVGVNQFCRFPSSAWTRCWAALVR